MKSKVLGAVTYPAVVILFSFFALFVAVKFVVPRIASVLEGFGRELPLLTRAVILFSDLLTLLFYLSPLLLILLLFRKKIIRRERFDRLVLRLPGIGRISFCFDLSRFAYTLYMTLSSAVPMPTAFRISIRSMSNSYLRATLENLSPEIERGRSISYVLRKAGFFPPLFVNLVETGENSGELERMLSLTADLFRRDALRSINLWVRMIEPLSILIIVYDSVKVVLQLWIVGSHDKAYLLFLVQLPEEVKDLSALLPVYVTGGFICKYNGRFAYERPAYGNPLLLPSGELMGFVV